MFFYSGETVWVRWGFLKITKEGVFYTIFLSARLFLLVMGSAILTLTTTPVSLTDGIESLLYPLKLIRFPVHELALIMSIALRFYRRTFSKKTFECKTKDIETHEGIYCDMLEEMFTMVTG